MVGIKVPLKFWNLEYLILWLQMLNAFHCRPELLGEVFLVPKENTFIV